MKIVLFDSFDDIQPTGEAIVWELTDGADLNKPYICSCLYEMCTAKELFAMIVNNEEIEIEPERAFKYCKPRR